MTYLFDTNAIVHYLKDSTQKEAIERDLSPFAPGHRQIISIVTIGELFALATKNGWGKRRIEKMEIFLRQFAVIELRYGALLRAYADIDAYSHGKLKEFDVSFSARNMGKNDLWIAATARVSNASIITTDHDFSHLDGIMCSVALFY